MENKGAVLNRASSLLRDRFSSLQEEHGASGLNEEWSRYLEGFGASRISKIMGLCTEAIKGNVRVADPMLVGGNHGFIEMPEEVAEKIATLGAP